MDQNRDHFIAEVSQRGIRGSDQGSPHSRGELEGGSVDQIRDLLIAEVSQRGIRGSDQGPPHSIGEPEGDPRIRSGTS